jgi:hypothetical protein
MGITTLGALFRPFSDPALMRVARAAALQGATEFTHFGCAYQLIPTGDNRFKVQPVTNEVQQQGPTRPGTYA